MKISDEIADLPASAVSCLWVAFNIFLPLFAPPDSAAITWEYARISVAPLSWFAFIFPVGSLWYVALYYATKTRSTTAPRVWLVPLAPAAYLIAVFSADALYHRINQPPAMLIAAFSIALFVTVFGLLEIVWAGARSLNEADRKPDGTRYSNIATTILLMYLPIGIWFLQSRIHRTINKLPPEPAQ